MKLFEKQIACRNEFTELNKKYLKLDWQSKEAKEIQRQMNKVSKRFYSIRKFMEIGVKIKHKENY